MLKKIILLILFFQSLQSSAQLIQGKVFDQEKKPIAYATASLVNSKDSVVINTVLTNKDGAFSFNSNLKDALLRVSYIGYKTVVLPLIDSIYKEITIVPDTSLMQNVTVVYKPPAIFLKGASLIINIKNTTISNIGTATKLLNKIPGIQSGMDGIEVHGKGKTLIYINNRLVRNISELEQLPSKEIENVEVSMNPGAEYDASVGAIIKIKTIKKQGDGLSGSIILGTVYADAWQHRETVNLNYRKGNFDVFGSIDNINAYFSGYSRQNILLNSDSLRTLNQNMNAWQKGYTFDSKVGASYNYKATSLGVSYNLGFSPYKWNTGKGVNDQIFKVDNVWRSQMQSEYSLNLANQSHRINTYYNDKIKSKLAIDFNYDYITGKDNSDQTIFENINVVNANSNSRYNLHIEKFIFSYPVLKGEWKIGEEGSLSHIENKYSNSGFSNFNNKDLNNEWKIALFTTYSKKINKTSFQGGIRYESLKFENNTTDTGNEKVSKVFNSLFPSMSISLPIRKTNLSLSYSSKIQRPGFSILNSNIEYINRFVFKQGNPMLLPQYTHDFTANLIYKHIFSSVSYQYTKNFIADIIDKFKNKQDVLLKSYINVPQKQQMNLSISYSPKIKLWEPSFNLYASQQFLSINYNGTKKYFNNPTVNLTNNNEITLPNNFVISLDISLRSAGNVGLLQRQADWSMDLNVRKSLLKDALTIYFGGMDIFKTQRSYYTLYGYNFSMNTQRALNTRMIQLAVIYQFNSTYNKYKGRNSSEYSERVKREQQF